MCIKLQIFMWYRSEYPIILYSCLKHFPQVAKRDFEVSFFDLGLGKWYGWLTVMHFILRNVTQHWVKMGCKCCLVSFNGYGFFSQNLMESLDSLLCAEGSESLKSLCLKLLLCLVTVSDHLCVCHRYSSHQSHG